MNTRAKTVGLTLAGAVALASGAYALGSQAEDGSATAAAARTADTFVAPGPPGPPGAEVRFRAGGPDGPAHGFAFFGLRGLADKLGVDRQQLRQALKELRSDQSKPDPSKARGDFAAALADELGIDQSKLEDAFDKVQEKLRKEMEARHDEFVQKLADKLGISVDKVNEAFPDPPRMFERRHP